MGDDFFPPQEKPASPGPRRVRPPWDGPPGVTFSGLLPMQRVLARSASAIMVLIEVRAYVAGCVLEFLDGAEIVAAAANAVPYWSD